MADNFTFLQPDGTTRTSAADDIGGNVLAQRVKWVIGGDGTGADVTDRNPVPFVASKMWEVVEAGQTSQVLGTAGAAGDYLYGLLLIPQTVSPGSVSIQDGTGTTVEVFNGGTGAVASKVPFFIPLNMLSLSGAWKVTTGGNVRVIAQGTFT